MSTSDLIFALHQALHAEAEEAAARERYDGESWDYHGYNYMVASEVAASRFESELKSLIDARIDAALGAGK
ncbi:MAG: hypothetical protein RL030_1763 [Pseudomonadota bacterium]|jgi:hypothetical protein